MCMSAKLRHESVSGKKMTIRTSTLVLFLVTASHLWQGRQRVYVTSSMIHYQSVCIVLWLIILPNSV